jgi:hypothetical protein
MLENHDPFSNSDNSSSLTHQKQQQIPIDEDIPPRQSNKESLSLMDSQSFKKGNEKLEKTREFLKSVISQNESIFVGIHFYFIH